MIKFIIKKTIRNWEKTSDPVVRRKYEILSGVMGIICNAILFAIKLSVGLIMGSIAIMSDAFNNLSDMGSSFVTIVGAKISGKRPDKKHPFGYGRIEYICAFIVSALIMLVGFELLKSSFDKIIHPNEVKFNFVLIGILTASILIKVYMFFYNRYISREINSQMIRATATDSLTDCISTGAVIIATVIGHFLSFPVDGIIGLIVALLIIYSGFNIAKDIVTALLGSTPDPDIVKAITDIVKNGECIEGIHDMLVHDYGPGRIIASVHAEVSDKCDIVKVHEIIDALEKKVSDEVGVLLVIHMDPISTDENVNDLRNTVAEIAKSVNENLLVHDLRITDGEERINIIFDLVIPVGTSVKDEEAWIEEIKRKIKEKDSRYVTVMNIDYGF